MNNNDTAAQTTAAVLAQLNAEITAHDMDVKTLAALMDIDYNTFRRYTKGERVFPLPIFLRAITTIGMTTEEFMKRAEERLAHG